VDLDHRRVSADIDSLWGRWDANGDGSINYSEFVCGLLPYLLEHYPRPPGSCPPRYNEAESGGGAGAGTASNADAELLAMRAAGRVPDMASKPRLWFAYWDDEDGGNGELSKAEVLRAIVKTFRLESSIISSSSSSSSSRERDTQRALGVAAALDAVWPLFDHDGSGEIDVGEFTATDGLCDTLLATLVHERI